MNSLLGFREIRFKISVQYEAPTPVHYLWKNQNFRGKNTKYQREVSISRKPWQPFYLNSKYKINDFLKWRAKREKLIGRIRLVAGDRNAVNCNRDYYGNRVQESLTGCSYD